MLLDLDKFYNSNYKDFVHKEALEEALKSVPEAFLKDVETKAILSITFSVDDYGENPIYIEYLDEKDQKHLVKLKPAISEKLDNVLKEYAKVVYVDQKVSELNAKIEAGDNKTLADSKHYTDEVKNILTVNINESKEEAINISKQYTNERETAIRNDLTTSINNAKQESLNYTDTKVDEAKRYAEDQNKVYGWDGTIWEKCNGNFAVNHDETNITGLGYRQEVDDEQSTVDFNTFAKKTDVLNDIIKGDTNTLNIANGYTDDLRDDVNSQLENYATKTYAEDQNKVYGWDGTIWEKCNGNFTVNHDETNITGLTYRQEAEDDGTRIDFNTFARHSDIAPLMNKLSNIWATHKAPFIYWLPNIDVNTMKLENTENDVKVRINDVNDVYWSKNPTITRAQVEAIVQEQISELKANNEKLKKIIQNLTNSGAWNPDTNDFNSGRNIATGNINFFGGAQDGASFIRTNNGHTENDVTAGI